MKNPLDHLDDVVQALVAALHPRRVVLFGSAARPDAVEVNDLDLLVVADSTESPLERMSEARLAVASLGVPVDIFVYTPDEYARLLEWKSSIVAEAAASGRSVYEAA